MNLRGQDGSSVLEALVSLILLVILFGAAGLAATLSVSRVWAWHVLHEAVICVAEDRAPRICENQARRRFVSLVRWGHLEKLRGREGESTWKGDLKWRFQNFHQISLTRELRLMDLKRRARRDL